MKQNATEYRSFTFGRGLLFEACKIIKQYSFRSFKESKWIDGWRIIWRSVNKISRSIVWESNPYTKYVHCWAHKVHLVLVSHCKDNNNLSITFPSPQELHKLSDIHWTCRVVSVSFVLRDILALTTVFSDLRYSKYPEANGLFSSFKKS